MTIFWEIENLSIREFIEKCIQKYVHLKIYTFKEKDGKSFFIYDMFYLIVFNFFLFIIFEKNNQEWYKINFDMCTYDR